MRVTHLFSGIPTADFDSAVVWYTRLLGRAPDRFPRDGEAVWQLSESGLIYVVHDPVRAGNGLVMLMVDDWDTTIDEIEQGGIEVGDVETMRSGARKTTLHDLDGNSIGIGQPPRVNEAVPMQR